MDKLSATQQQQVRKMSDERLRTKLVEYGFDEKLVSIWSREELLNRFAETMVPGAKAKEPTGFDAEFERERLDFEKMKWEQQRDLENKELKPINSELKLIDYELKMINWKERCLLNRKQQS